MGIARPVRIFGLLSVVVALLPSTGCQNCGSTTAPSEVTLVLHLPPEPDVAMPETLKACQDTTCLSKAIPRLPTDGSLATFTVSSSPAVIGFLASGPGGVRRLEIGWSLLPDVFDPKDPRNAYHVTVVDATGATTGALDADIMYTHLPGSACGPESWRGAASD
jgi:hypothetical protein